MVQESLSNHSNKQKKAAKDTQDIAHDQTQAKLDSGLWHYVDCFKGKVLRLKNNK